jgi:hypothetical protein
MGKILTKVARCRGNKKYAKRAESAERYCGSTGQALERLCRGSNAWLGWRSRPESAIVRCKFMRTERTKWARQVAMLHDFDRQNVCSPTASTGLIYGPAASSKSIEPRFGGGSHSWHLHHLWICETSSTEPVAVSVFSPDQSGDKRDLCLRATDWQSSRLSSGVCVAGLGPVTGGVVFSKLSKLLNQEDALSVPCLWGDFALRMLPRGPQEYWGKALIRRF